MLMKLYT